AAERGAEGEDRRTLDLGGPELVLGRLREADAREREPEHRVGALEDLARGRRRLRHVAPHPHLLRPLPRKEQREQGSLLVGGDDLAGAIGPAGRADPVRGLGLPALRAQRGGGHRERVVRPPLVALRTRGAILGNGHQLRPPPVPSRRAFNTAKGESPAGSGQPQAPALRSAPQRGHSPAHSSRHSGFTGSARQISSWTNPERSISPPRYQPVSSSSARHIPERESASTPSGSPASRPPARPRTRRN